MPPRTRERRSSLAALGGFVTPNSVVTLAAAAGTFWLAYDGGGYGLSSRGTAAVALLWVVAVAGALGLGFARPSPASLAVGGLLAALAFWTLLSTAWAASAEDAFAEFNRVVLYLAVFALVAVTAARGARRSWVDGMAVAIAALGVVAVASRLFPGFVDSGELETLLPTAHARLSWPLNYWNGLAVLCALGFPLLLRAGVASRSVLVRGLAIAPLPVLACAIYLASSRGGAAAALLGTAAFVVASASPWRAAVATALATGGSALAVAILHGRPELVNPALGRPPPADEGHAAALLIFLVCAALAVIWAGASRLKVRPPSYAAGRVALAGAAVVLLGLVALAHPIRRVENFKRPPQAFAEDDPDFVQSHLFSSNGSGRWQFWSTALDEFGTKPLNGRGAGSYQAYWAQHGSLAVFVRDAHSLYLEALGELGLIGFGLLVGSFGLGVAIWLARLRRGREAGPERDTTAAAGAAFLAYALAAGIDWMWELPAVSVVGIACLALMAGGTATRALPSRPHVALRAVVAAAAVCLVVAQLIPVLRDHEIGASRSAVARGDTAGALEAAARARDLEPWAATPYLQLALVEEQAGELPRAEESIREAIERNELDWRLWLIAARIQTKRGEIRLARRSLARARALNPRSPLLRTAAAPATKPL